jgi:phosphatidyl-myo-inositol dimannoside synthase
MRIGIISPEFPPDVGGIQTYAFEYAQEVARRGHEVTVFTKPHPQGELSWDGLKVEPVLRLRRRLDRAVIHRHRMDVWHCLNAAYAWIAAEVAPVFVTVHGNDFLAPYFRVGQLDLKSRLNLPFGSRADHWLGDLLTRHQVRRCLPMAEHIFTNSRYTERKFLQHHPDCSRKTSPAMVGVSNTYLSAVRPPRSQGPPRLITVCRLSESRKNVNLVLHALATLRDAHSFQYTIVGDGRDLPKLKQLAIDLGLGERVHFAGFLDQAKLTGLLLESDLFVLTSSTTSQNYEGFGIVYLEANACGCPVLAARTGGASEAVDENKSGIFVDEPTVPAIASALARFFSGEIRFDANACQTFAQKFSWSQVVNHCLPYYYSAQPRDMKWINKPKL